MNSTRLAIQDFFCATWLSKRALNRCELTRALNHRSHRQWLVAYIERKPELTRFNLMVALSIVLIWLNHHINYRVRQVMAKAWLTRPALAIDHARAALDHHDPMIREDGLAVLAYFGDANSLSKIHSLRSHPNPQTRYRATLAARAIERDMPILFVAPAQSGKYA